MFRFEHPVFFWIAVLPLLLVATYYLRRYLVLRSWKAWGTDESNLKATAGRSLRPGWVWIPFVASILLTIAMVNPQWGYRSMTVESKSADIYILLDISNSMLAGDVAPNRLERARRFAMDVSTAFRTDKVGLILFAGNAYIQSPLTTDWHAIQLYLNAAHPDQAGTQGTAIGEAIRLAIQPKPGTEITTGGALILITDGEDHDGEAPEAVAAAAEAGWATYIIGVGTTAGATIPMLIDGVPDVKRDENGQPVTTALNRELMKTLAQQGSGNYYDLDNGEEILKQLRLQLADLERTQLEKRSFSEHRSYFQLFLLPAILLMLLLAVVNYKYDLV